jgi:putative tryptophan/tyrosine transport system substrate-binding protein
MRRRAFIAGLGSAAAWPLVARAQQQPAMPMVGVLFFGTESLGQALGAAFRKDLGEEGYFDGRNVEILYRFTDMYDRLPGLAADLRRRGVSIIASMGAGSPSLAAMAATATTPIVFLVGSDSGAARRLVPNVDLPGANGAKRLGLLVEIVPTAKSIGYFHNPTVGEAEARIRTIETAARTLGVRLVIANANTPSEIEPAFTTFAGQRTGALVLGTNPLFIARTDQLIALAAQYRLPAIYPYREQVEAGGLMSYGASISDAWRLAGTYAGSILEGEKPVQQSTHIEMVLNLKTAKVLGLEVPTAIRQRFDTFIE